MRSSLAPTLLTLCMTACYIERTGGGPTDADRPRDGGPRDVGMPMDIGPVDAPPVDVGPVDSPECGPADESCSGGVAIRCAGGRLVMESCALGCSTTAPTRCAALIPSNIAPAAFDPAAPDTALAMSAAFDTSSCAGAPIGVSRLASQVGGGQVCLVTVGRLEIMAGVTLTVRGAFPLVIAASDEVIIAGTIDLSARAHLPGPGGQPGFVDSGTSIASTAGRLGSTAGSQNGGGGGGALCGGGGPGGPAAAGGAAGGSGGVAVDPSMYFASPLTGGSQGAIGIGPGVPGRRGSSGGGGGAIQISSLVRIRILGVIDASGGAGTGGGASPTSDSGAGGGGGAGGATLLEAPEVAFEGTGMVRVAGGGGGGGANEPTPAGSPGTDGFGVAGRPPGGAPTTTGGSGGGGAGGTDVAGGAGGMGVGPQGNGGGGGGGAGCIVIHTASGDLPVGAGNSSPSVEPALRSRPVARD